MSRKAKAKPVICGDCDREAADDTMLTTINPEGGYDLPQFLVCDDCMKSGRWDEWIAEHWPNWPREPRIFKLN